MSQPIQHRIIAHSAWRLALPAALIGLLLALTQQLTQPQISANQRQARLQQLQQVLPDSHYDNDPLAEVQTINDPALSAAPALLYRLRQQQQLVGLVLDLSSPSAYNGAIQFLLGIDASGQISGVRVYNHQETPGLGDKIEAEKSTWIEQFNGKSLNNPEHWGVKRDGGDFDQFTGATITPRAVVKAVRNTLIYFRQHKDELFAPQALAGVDDSTQRR